MSDCRKCAKAETCAVDEDCGLYVEKQMTNADRIRAMTDEELARYIYHLVKKGNQQVMVDYECGLNWLKDSYDTFFFDYWLNRYAVDNGACSADETSEKVQGGE